MGAGPDTGTGTESHWRFGVEPQAEMRPGIIELRWGDPDPALLPVGAVAAAAAWVADTVGPAALNYGVNEGPSALREALAARISAAEGHHVGLHQIAVTNGNTPSLQLLLSQLLRPGDIAFVEDPGFSLALRLARDVGVDLVGVPLDGGGMDVEALPEIAAHVRAGGRRPRAVYTVPTFHNPTGTCLDAARRRRLVELAVEEDLLIIEDDVYRELSFDGPAPESLWRIAGDVDGAEDHVIRLGSFSKTLAPGLRCGWLTSSAARVKEFTDRGVLDGAGCMTQFCACVCARLVVEGAYDDNLVRLRSAYAARRDALVAGLRAALPAGCKATEPGGGFFLWVSLPDELTGGELVGRAEAHGVSLFEGSRFSVSGADRGLRLGFSMYEPGGLLEGAARLGRALGGALDGG